MKNKYYELAAPTAPSLDDNWLAALVGAGIRWAHKDDCRTVDCDCHADHGDSDLAASPTFDALCRVEPLS